jgi:hypothetical protein
VTSPITDDNRTSPRQTQQHPPHPPQLPPGNSKTTANKREEINELELFYKLTSSQNNELKVFLLSTHTQKNQNLQTLYLSASRSHHSKGILEKKSVFVFDPLWYKHCIIDERRISSSSSSSSSSCRVSRPESMHTLCTK